MTYCRYHKFSFFAMADRRPTKRYKVWSYAGNIHSAIPRRTEAANVDNRYILDAAPPPVCNESASDSDENIAHTPPLLFNEPSPGTSAAYFQSPHHASLSGISDSAHDSDSDADPDSTAGGSSEGNSVYDDPDAENEATDDDDDDDNNSTASGFSNERNDEPIVEGNNEPVDDPYNLDERINFQGNLSKFEVLVMILHFVIRFSLSDVCIKALVEMINVIIGDEVIPPSNYIFNNIFKTSKKGKFFLYCSNCQFYLGPKEECNLEYCPSCHEAVDPATLNQGHYFIGLSVIDQIREKLEGPNGESMINYVERRTSNEEIISDVFDGYLFKQLNQKVSASGPFITLTVNTDGAKVFNNSSRSLWPIQFFINEISPKERFAPYNILLAGLWFGQSGLSIITYFSYLIDEAQKMAREGIRWFRAALNKEEVTKVYFLNCVVDTVAKAKVLNMKQFNGHCACGLCLHEGDCVAGNQVRYGCRDEYPPRTNASVQAAMKEAQRTGQVVDGMKGMSALCFLPNFSLTYGVIIDYMHSHLLGVTKYLCIEIWLNSKYHEEEFYLDANKIKQIDRRLQRLHPPSEISRDPRPFSACTLWKANEWRNFLFHYGPVVLQGILPPRYFRHFCLLSASLYFFCQASINRTDIPVFGDYLSAFNTQCQHFYGLVHMVYNIHTNVHLRECVIRCGPLWCYSAFSFETGNGFLIKLVKGSNGVAQQIARKYCMYSSLPLVIARHPPLTEEVVEFCDKTLKLRRFKVAEKCQEVTVVGNKFRRKITPTVEELAKLTEAFPEIDIDRTYFIKKVIFNGSIFTSSPVKTVKKNNTFLCLANGSFVKIVTIFLKPSLNYDEVCIIVREVKVEDDREINIFGLDNFHIKMCEEYAFGDLVIISARELQDKCFFMAVEDNFAAISNFPNKVERD